MSASWIDRTDVRILDLLQRDGRVSNVELADRIALSPTPCLRRVKRLEEEGLIACYRAELDRKKIGFSVTAFVHVNIDKHGPEATKAFLDAADSIEEIIACHILTGTFDFLLEVVAETLDAYSNVMLDRLGGLPGVTALQTSFALKSTKRSQVLPLGHLQRATAT